MRLRPVLANMLPNLEFAQLSDQPRPENDAKEKRCKTGEGGAEGDEPEDSERPNGREKLLVEQVIQHENWLSFVARQQPFHRLFHRDTARSLEQNGVALPGEE